MTQPPPILAGAAGLSPSKYGYRLASKVRDAAGLSSSAPVPSVNDVAQSVTGKPFRTQNHNHVPGERIQAVVGWTPNNETLLAGPQSLRKDNQRFLAARGLYHALFACDRGERLVTRAFTWDQQASRAFAAELLAPQAALISRAPGNTDRAKVEELAREFDVSQVVIANQLENAGATLVDE
jgi:Zn-dependent peptidase ImmA (M78 family)